MLIYVRISEDLKGKVDALVSSGQYSDVSAAVSVALENLLLAEEEHATENSKRRIPVESSQPIEVPTPTPQQHSKSSRTSKPVVPSKPNTARPAIFNWTRSPLISEDLIIPAPADLFRPGQQVPVERWVFGQQNRVLPVKVNVRLFLVLISASGSEMELFDAASAIADGAGEVFRFLSDLDQKFSHGKDDLLSTGFPEPESDKAKSRYANHFTAYENTQGNLTGMLLQWKFAGVRRAKNKTYLLPTQACLDFANLTNPLLDQPVMEKPTQKFSQEEIAWLGDHIAKNVPVEAGAYRTILNGLQDGRNTPDALDSYVREHAKGKTDLTEAFLSTQRSGAVSRMADLNLIRRQRDGTKVSYEITELSEKWLKQYASDVK